MHMRVSFSRNWYMFVTSELLLWSHWQQALPEHSHWMFVPTAGRLSGLKASENFAKIEAGNAGSSSNPIVVSVTGKWAP